MKLPLEVVIQLLDFYISPASLSIYTPPGCSPGKIVIADPQSGHPSQKGFYDLNKDNFLIVTDGWKDLFRGFADKDSEVYKVYKTKFPEIFGKYSFVKKQNPPQEESLHRTAPDEFWDNISKLAT